MQKKIKTKSIKEKVMSKILKEGVEMKPKWWFVLGSSLSVLGLSLLGGVVTYVFNLMFFLERVNGYGRGMRYGSNFSVLPWWLPVVGLSAFVAGLYLLKKYDFSYKKNFAIVILGIVLAVVVGGNIVDATGTNERLIKQRGFGRFYGIMSESLVTAKPTVKASTDLEKALIVAINDEYKAWSTYKAVTEKFGNVRPFSNIIGAEEQHIASLKILFEKYGLAVPENAWEGKITLQGDLSDVCAVAYQAEIDNYKLYEDKLVPEVSDYVDVIAVFENLASASKNKHLPAFAKCK